MFYDATFIDTERPEDNDLMFDYNTHSCGIIIILIINESRLSCIM